MKIENYLSLDKKLGVSGLFLASGSFGMVDSEAEYTVTEADGIRKYTYNNGKLELCASFERDVGGVTVRRDYLRNVSDEPIVINKLLSRFCLDGNRYEVYTQYNSWQHESLGAWQPLVTEVGVSSRSIRTCDGATPMMGFHNLYSGKNTVFHLVPNAQWKMRVKKVPVSDKELAVLECGFEDTGLCMKVSVGEKIDLPTVIFYGADSKLDLDAYKLHTYFNEHYPRRRLPVIYNSWLYCFAKLDIDELKRQAECAAEMGIEAFMIDAGWFGDGGGWFSSVGDWTENMNGGPRGRLLELSRHVRSLGMTFGLWFEPERASEKSKSVAAHPDYYIDGRFLDFSNPEAREYILGIISEQIEKYSVGWVKFDFNAATLTDPDGCAFYHYFEGQRLFIKAIRERFPELYITNCAGGGFRMELGQAMLADSFWPTDNESPCDGLRIVKDTIKRMPPSLLERWNVQKYCENIPIYGRAPEGRMIHCNDGTWESLIGIDDSFSEEFMKGGPLGFSCDIASFPEKYKTRWSEVIRGYKKKRDFFAKATARLLVDSDSVVAIQYSDTELRECYIQVFTKTVYADGLIIYPAVDKDAVYTDGERELSASEIIEDGIYIKGLGNNRCVSVTLLKK